MNHFRYDALGRLCAESVELARIASEVSTPTFVYSRATVERHFRVYDESFRGHPHLVCYSVKANSNLAVLRVLARLGAGADVVSGGELARALRAQIPGDRIVFSGVGKSRARCGPRRCEIAAFNVESEAELEVLDTVARKWAARSVASVNPNIDAKTHPTSRPGSPIRSSVSAFGCASLGRARSVVDLPLARRDRLSHRIAAHVDRTARRA